MYSNLHRPLIETRPADLTGSPQQGQARLATRNTEPTAERPSIVPRGRLIALLTTIAMFALPVADALASRSWT